MDHSLETVLERTEISGSEIDGEFVFFNQELGKYFATDGVGGAIWQFLATPHSITEICDHLQGKYEIDRNTCETQTKEFISKMVLGGILRAAR